jgi:hypothetical protein
VAKPAIFHTSICKAPSLPKCVVVHWQHRHCLSICRSSELPEAIILVCATRSLANWGQGTVQALAAPCATLSMLTYYRTSRSLHFPFGAVCSLSGAQPKIWPVSWKPPVERQLVVCLLVLSIQRSGVPVGRRVRGPRAPLARCTWAAAAQGGSEGCPECALSDHLRVDVIAKVPTGALVVGVTTIERVA